MKRTAPLKSTKGLARHTPLRAGTRLVSRSELRRTPLAQVSAKRLTALKTAGKKTIPAKRARYTGPAPATVATVVERDRGCCAWCGDPVAGDRGWDWSVHHRLPRRAGGSNRLDVNLPSNLVLVHGHGSSACHGEIEGRRIAAVALGFLLPAGCDPAAAPIEHAVHGWVWLTPGGGTSSVRPEAVAA